MLVDKNVIVTGSSTGIGWSIAEAIYAEGANVLLHGTNEDALRQKSETLGERAAFIVADLADPESPARIVDFAIERFGSVDCLVNNAAVMTRNTLEDLTVEAFDRIMAINARAPLLMCQQVISHFRARNRGGSIVNIGSINAHCGQDNILVYSMSKGAMQTMTRNLGDALGPEKIRINQLNVGWTLTENEHKIQVGEGRPEDWLDQVPAVFAPSGSILKPEHIAPHVIFWLSERSAPINGQVYEVEQYPVIGRNKINQA